MASPFEAARPIEPLGVRLRGPGGHTRTERKSYRFSVSPSCQATHGLACGFGGTSEHRDLFYAPTVLAPAFGDQGSSRSEQPFMAVAATIANHGSVAANAHADHCVYRGTQSFRGSGPWWFWTVEGVDPRSPRPPATCAKAVAPRNASGRRCTHATCPSYRRFEKFAELARTALVFRCRMSGSGFEPMVLERWSHDRRRAHGLSQLPGRS